MTRRPALIRAGRATGRLALAAAVVGGVVWASGQPAVTSRIDGLDLARESAAIASLTSTTVALERATLSCPGPELIGLDGARELALATGVTLVAAPLPDLGDIPTPTGDPSLQLLAGTGGGEQSEGPVLTAPLEAATSSLATAGGTAAPAFVATQETLAETDEVSGLATVPCQAAGPQAWVVGGGGGPGRAERLVLTNPGSNAVTVDITAYGSAGTTSPPGGQDVIIPAHGRTVLLGDALAPDEANPAFAVTATGGDLTVALVETAIEGTRPVGFDVTPAAAPPAEEQLIPGVLVPAAEEGSLTVRIVNPGEAEAIATVSYLSAAGEVAIPESVARVPAGGATDVPVDGLPRGATALVVRADSPIVAAARTVVDDGAADATWAVSQAPLTELAGTALPPSEGLERTLVVSALGAGATVEVVAIADGESSTRQVLVPSGGTVQVPATGDGTWIRQISGAGSLVGAVVTTNREDGTTAVSALALTVPTTSARRSEVVPLP